MRSYIRRKYSFNRNNKRRRIFKYPGKAFYIIRNKRRRFYKKKYLHNKRKINEKDLNEELDNYMKQNENEETNSSETQMKVD